MKKRVVTHEEDVPEEVNLAREFVSEALSEMAYDTELRGIKCEVLTQNLERRRTVCRGIGKVLAPCL